MRIIYFCFCCLLYYNHTPAQKVNHPTNVNFIIIQLSSEINRIRYFQNRGLTKDANIIISESKKQRELFTQDFTDNFTFCPVYYFIDTNINLVKNRKFEDCLFDATGNKFPPEKAAEVDSNYLILEFGYPDDNTSVTTSIKGLVVRNRKFQQIKYFMKAKSPNSRYVLKPRLYEISYKPFAIQFNRYIAGNFDE